MKNNDLITRVGLVMLSGSSTGGTTILAELISLKSRYKISQIILVRDLIH